LAVDGADRVINEGTFAGDLRVAGAFGLNFSIGVAGEPARVPVGSAVLSTHGVILFGAWNEALAGRLGHTGLIVDNQSCIFVCLTGISIGLAVDSADRAPHQRTNFGEIEDGLDGLLRLWLVDGWRGEVALGNRNGRLSLHSRLNGKRLFLL
jgi:hypothetical protein